MNLYISFRKSSLITNNPILSEMEVGLVSQLSNSSDDDVAAIFYNAAKRFAQEFWRPVQSRW